MRLKENTTYEKVQEKLREKLSSHIKVKLRTNPIYKNLKWIEVNKDSFVGLKIFLRDNELLVDTHTPGFIARAFFGGIVSGLFYYQSRKNFEQTIADFLVSEFYEE